MFEHTHHIDLESKTIEMELIDDLEWLPTLEPWAIEDFEDILSLESGLS